MRKDEIGDIILVTGTSVLGMWMAELMYEICALAGVELVEGFDDGLLPDLGRVGGVPRVLMTMALSRRHIDLIESARIAVMAVLDDPVDSFRLTKAAKGLSTHEALREQTRIACTNYLFHANPLATVVARSYAGTVHDLLASLLDVLGAAPAPSRRPELLERYGGPFDRPWTLEEALEKRIPRYLELNRLSDAVTAEEATTVRQVLSPLVLGAVSDRIGTVTWSAKVFYFGDRPDEIAPAIADVTGAARIIFYGPYFYLPPGTWRCRMVVAFSPEVSGTPFKLVVRCLQDPIAKVMIRPTDGGAFEGYFTMRHLYPERSIEVQFMSDEGTIEGHVGLGQLTFMRETA